MNWLDIVIIVTLVASTYGAYRAGIIRESVTLLSVIVGVAAAGFLYEDLAGDLDVIIESRRASLIVGYLAILAAVIVTGQLLAFLLKSAVKMLFLGYVDQLAGAAFGFLKGFFLVEAVLMLFVTYPALGLRAATEESLIGSVFLDVFPLLLAVLPGEFDHAVRSL